ncbi:hypothetical protein AX15_000544 [Amanita polypyramis BW_CC]|nr:hypothetical protein AX15_000544 [Amanita polypyramis BW_CC]
MILHRCPELSELTICSFSPYTCSFDISPLLVPVLDSAKVSSDVDARPRFPKLTSLTLGSFGYLSDFTLGMPSDPLFGQFISTHPSLTTLRLLWTFRRWVSPDVVPLIVSPTLRPLPKLTTFIGIYQQLAEIPEEHRARIEVVDLTCEPVYEGRVRKVVDVLKTMSGLRCMEVWVHVGEGMGMGDDGEEEGRRVGDSGSSFGNLVGACPPGLEELHFMCTTPFTRVSTYPLLFLFLFYFSDIPTLNRNPSTNYFSPSTVCPLFAGFR